MARDKTKEYEQELLEVIKKHKIAFFDHCFAFTSFCPATAYNHNLEKLDTIKNGIKNNRVKAKNYLLNKWLESDNATLNISAYRLLSDSEEHQKLNQSYIDHTSKGNEINRIERIIISPDANKDS